MKRVPLVVLLTMFASAVLADDQPDPSGAASGLFGHSAHGEAFNEGPRLRGVLMPGTGNVHFAVTTKNEEAQQFFDQGVGQLHGFWYFEAERSFRQAAALDPDCAMAFWGMAMCNLNNVKRASEFIKKAVALRDKVSRREQLWIDGLSDYFIDTKKSPKDRRQTLIKSLEKIVYEFPDDIEAKAFLVFWVWDSKDKDLPITSYTAVDALAQEILAVNPMHPVHHYRIHLWNFEDDQRALNSAALCGQSAPGIAHMWHMPGHTFTKLKRYADAAWQQEASARVDHAHMISTRILPEQIHNYAHNNDWLVEDLQFIGRVQDAWDLAKNMIELPRMAPKNNPTGARLEYDNQRSGYAMGRNRLLETALRFELWSELSALENTMYLAPAEDPVDEVKRERALAIAAFSRGNTRHGAELVAALEAELKKARDARVVAADEAEAAAKQAKKSPDETSKAMADALKRFSRRTDAIRSALAEARLFQALAATNVDEARKQLGLATDLTPERKARVLYRLGDKPGAEAAAREAVSRGEGQVLPLAILTDILWRSGKKTEAVQTFTKLRDLSAQVDLGVNVFARLFPVAREAGFNGDWRPKLEFPVDSGARPPLAQLGPFRWRPYEAPDWSLSDQNGRQVSLSEFHGKPVLVMFYLGSGCSHCIEQLNVFGPATKDYAAAGITLLAVSTDSADALHETFAKAKDAEGFPFSILADPKMDAFKSYRAFDDFENTPLHGMFLIDRSGYVRWQDISYEPFKDAAWLLKESKRLLALPVTSDGGTAAALPADEAPTRTVQ
ncbi:redoxin domain-containing protein [Verrucomicrobiota bacterium sgz303538]